MNNEKVDNTNVYQNDLEMRPSLNDIPDEILQAIIMSLAGRDWPQMELVSRRFQLCVLACWKSLKIVHLEEFCNNALVFLKDDSGKQDLLQRLLRMLYYRSPGVQSISGFSTFVSELHSRTVEYLTHFQNLKSVTFSDCKITTAGLATFLNDTNSRNVLEELCVNESLRCTFENNTNTDSSHEDELLLQAFLNTPDRPPLRLRKFRYVRNKCCKGSFLAGLDTSRLEILSLVDVTIDLQYVGELLERCVELQEFQFDGMNSIHFEGASHQSAEAFLNAVVSLTAISFRRLELCNCVSKQHFVSAVLSQVGRRYDRLESLCISDDIYRPGDRIAPVIGEYFTKLTTLEMDVAFVEKGDLVQLMTRMGRLKRLGLYYSDPFLDVTEQDIKGVVDGDVVRAIVSNVRGLTSLGLYGVVITPENAEMLTQMKKLREVSIHWTELGEEAITWWCERFGPMIIELEMYSHNLTDSLILSIVNRLTRVRRLHFRATRITDAALYSIASSRLNMEELLLGCATIGGTLRITASGVQAVLDNCQKLAYVELCNTSVDLEEIVMNKRTRVVERA